MAPSGNSQRPRRHRRIAPSSTAAQRMALPSPGASTRHPSYAEAMTTSSASTISSSPFGVRRNRPMLMALLTGPPARRDHVERARDEEPVHAHLLKPAWAVGRADHESR